MISGINSFQLQAIAEKGGSFEVDGRAYSTAQLQAIAQKLTPGATLRIYHSETKNISELQALAEKRPGQVLFA